MDILNYIKPQTLDGRVLFSAPIVETVMAESGTNAEIHERAVTFSGGIPHLVSSQTLNNTHKPTLDIDLPCRLEPSATEGKFHLFIDKELSEEQYERLLRILVEVGIVEQGIIDFQWNATGATFVRLPGVAKTLSDGSTVKKPGSYEIDKTD